MIFIVMVLMVLSIAIVWNFDLHNVIHLKSRAQNAADASALAAARWQGVTLNLIGDLNIMQAVALSAGASNTASQIAQTQARLCFTGPMLGLMACQQAAKKNGIYVNESFTERLESHAASVRNDYPAVFSEPYPGCWTEYADMLSGIAAAGIAAGPDNTCYYTDYSGAHTLLDMTFYDAVSAREWCWFYWYALDLLETYVDYQSWPALPPMMPETEPANSEVFSLGLASDTSLPGGAPTVDLLNQLREARRLDPQVISNSVSGAAAVWFVYQPARWAEWEIMRDASFPVFPEKQVKPQYNYTGADAVARIEAVADRFMPSAPDRRISSTAAAKPFGFLTAGDGGALPPHSFGIVLPAFHSVRLIPVDSASGPIGGAYNLLWREHIENHLPVYVDEGVAGIDSACWYCQQLVTWEDASFRQDGIEWLADTNNTCIRFGSGPGPGGGTRRGH